MAVLRYMSGRDLVKQRSERVVKLAWIEQQVEDGTLIVRQATPAERRRYGMEPAPVEAPPPKPPKGRAKPSAPQ